MFGLRMPELLIIFAIVLLVFGANRVPQLGKALGETIRGFKKAVEEEPKAETPATPAAPAQLPKRSVAAATTVETETARPCSSLPCSAAGCIS